jgi:hypothetical protein
MCAGILYSYMIQTRHYFSHYDKENNKNHKSYSENWYHNADDNVLSMLFNDTENCYKTTAIGDRELGM